MINLIRKFGMLQGVKIFQFSIITVVKMSERFEFQILQIPLCMNS